MDMFERKQKPMRKAKQPASTGHSGANAGQNNAILSLQRTIGNQGVQQLLQAEVEEPKAGADAAASPRTADEMHRIAREGTAGSAGPLPHLDQIQRSFGPQHDLGGVKAHVGGRATEASRHLGAEAYTIGDHVAFGGTPDLHVAAHEAAHVIQQRAGVQLQDGIGRPGDKYEQHADQVASAVVAGRSAEGILGNLTGAVNHQAGVQKQAVQFWGEEHADFTARAVDRWNSKHPKGTPMHIVDILKAKMIETSDDNDYTGRALTGTVSDLRIYYDFITGDKKKRHKEYAEASPAKKKKMYEAAQKSVCASEGPTHGEGNRPNYGSGGSAVNHAWMMSQIKWADRLTIGGFMSTAGAGQLGDAMHCAQDRGSHREGNRHEGHDDVRDKLGIGDYNTDDPKMNIPGKHMADDCSDMVLEEFAKLRNPEKSSAPAK